MDVQNIHGCSVRSLFIIPQARHVSFVHTVVSENRPWPLSAQ